MNGGRPESTIAQSFAADLDHMFGLSSSTGHVRPPTAEAVEVADLTQTVHQKKQTLTTKDAELQELEARLRAAEERLAKVNSRNVSPSRAGAEQKLPSLSPAAASTSPANPTTSSSSPLAQKPTYHPERPPTQREDTATLMSGMPGALPQTPGVEGLRSGSGSAAGAGGDYVMVDQERGGVRR